MVLHDPITVFMVEYHLPAVLSESREGAPAVGAFTGGGLSKVALPGDNDKHKYVSELTSPQFRKDGSLYFHLVRPIFR